MPSWDLIVVGAGTAGMPCAIAAAELGARVLVVDKQPDGGGTLHLTGGSLSGAGTRRQRQRGIIDSADQHFADVMRITHGGADEVIVGLATSEAPQMIDWLDELGFPFDETSPILGGGGSEGYLVPRVYYGVDEGRSILGTIRPRWDELVSAGAITFLPRHALRDLVCDNGAVVGVRVSTGGSDRELLARVVVLATGGYGANPDLFAELTPGSAPLISFAIPAATGDGLIAARRIGAALRNSEAFLAAPGIFETEPGSGRARHEVVRFGSLTRAPREIYVNVRGERYIAEDDPDPHAHAAAVSAQPGRTVWVIFDAVGLADGPPLVAGWDSATIRAHAADGQFAWAADGVDELARMAGIDPAGLMRTVAAWNESTRSGRDPRGRREPGPSLEVAPLYAVMTRTGLRATAGGLAVDRELRVLDTEGAPIPGLYAVGEILGSAATMATSHCDGMMITPAISLGRIAGRQLARGRGAA